MPREPGGWQLRQSVDCKQPVNLDSGYIMIWFNTAWIAARSAAVSATKARG